MVVVSHLSLFLGDKIRGRCDSCESHLPLIKTIYFPIAPFLKQMTGIEPASPAWEAGVLPMNYICIWYG